MKAKKTRRWRLRATQNEVDRGTKSEEKREKEEKERKRKRK